MESPALENTPACPVCASARTEEVLHIPGVPVYCNVLHASWEDALTAPRGDLDLRFCPACGYLFNAAFDPARVEYRGDYENSLHFSGRFQDYAQGLAASLVERHGLRRKRVMEIACGQGDFLHLLCTLGGNQGIGYDPGHVAGRRDLAGGADITFFPDYWRAEAGLDADFLVCRHALEHLPRPVAFLGLLRHAIGDLHMALFFEVPDARFTLEGLGIWDLIYEHCGYFSPTSLREVFRRAGFRVQEVESAFGGQFLGLHAVPASEHEPEQARGGESSAAAGMAEADLGPLVGRFALAYRAKVARWQGRLEDLRQRGRRTLLWGAGSKGVSFVNTLKAGEAVAALIDLNPHKQGRFVPGTGHPVLAPATLKAEPPDVVIVLNPQYRDEIAADLKALGIRAEILVDEDP
jgi:hypothetical protein